MNDVLMIVWRSSRGEVYEGCLVVILYDGVWSCFLYTDLYNNVEVDDWHEVGFL